MSMPSNHFVFPCPIDSISLQTAKNIVQELESRATWNKLPAGLYLIPPSFQAYLQLRAFHHGMAIKAPTFTIQDIQNWLPTTVANGAGNILQISQGALRRWRLYTNGPQGIGIDDLSNIDLCWVVAKLVR